MIILYFLSFLLFLLFQRNRQELAEKAGNEIIKMNQDSSYKGKSYIVDFHIIERNSTKGV